MWERIHDLCLSGPGWSHSLQYFHHIIQVILWLHFFLFRILHTDFSSGRRVNSIIVLSPAVSKFSSFTAFSPVLAEENEEVRERVSKDWKIIKVRLLGKWIKNRVERVFREVPCMREQCCLQKPKVIKLCWRWDIALWVNKREFRVPRNTTGYSRWSWLSPRTRW